MSRCQPGWGTPSLSTIQAHLIKSYSSSFFKRLLQQMPMSSSSHTMPFQTLQSRAVTSNRILTCFWIWTVTVKIHSLFPRLGKGHLPRLCWSLLAFACSITFSRSDTKKCLLFGERQKWQYSLGFLRLGTYACKCPVCPSKRGIFRTCVAPSLWYLRVRRHLPVCVKVLHLGVDLCKST